MAKLSDECKVFEHGPIEKLADNLWRVEGSLPGMSLKRTMTIARRSDGRLALHSAIALREPEMQEIASWGSPSFLLVPNAYHRLDAPAYKKRYPFLSVLTPRGSRRRVARALAVDGTYEDFPEDDRVTLVGIPGVAEVEGAMFVRSSDGLTVVLNDVVFNMDPKRDTLGFVITSLLGSAPGPRVSRLAKALMVKDRGALRTELERLAELPELVRVVVSHEKVTSGRTEAQAMLRKAATFL
jgi:hypothetical protein